MTNLNLNVAIKMIQIPHVSLVGGLVQYLNGLTATPNEQMSLCAQFSDSDLINVTKYLQMNQFVQFLQMNGPVQYSTKWHNPLEYSGAIHCSNRNSFHWAVMPIKHAKCLVAPFITTQV